MLRVACCVLRGLNFQNLADRLKLIPLKPVAIVASTPSWVTFLAGRAAGRGVEATGLKGAYFDVRDVVGVGLWAITLGHYS